MDLPTWFRRWLSTHPLKEPPAHGRSAYTADVMAKVKALGRPAPSLAPVRIMFPWPRLALAMATAAVGVTVVFVALHAQTSYLAQQITRDAHVLAELDEPGSEPAPDGDVEALADELQMTDTFLLAESLPSDEQWVEQTLQLLEEAGDDAAEDAPGDASHNSEDEWLQELQQLDESDLSASS